MGSMNLKLTHKVLLLVTSPLLVVLIFLALLFQQLIELEQDNELASKTVVVMSTVERFEYHAMSLMANYFLFSQSNNDLTLWQKFKTSVSCVADDRNAVRAMIGETPGTQDEIKSLVSLIDDVLDSIAQAREFAQQDPPTAKRTKDRIYKQLTRATEAGEALIAKQNDMREIYLVHNTEESARLRTLIEISAVSIFIAAIIATVVLGVTVNRRLQILMTKTANIALGKELESRISGDDELSALDNIIHRLSIDLAASRRSERALIENTAEILWSLDESCRITEANPAVQVVLGLAVDDVLSSHIQTLVIEQDRSTTFHALDECKGSDLPRSFEARLRRTDGRIIDTVWTVRWSNSDKSFFCIVHDITERKEAERLRQQVLAMVSHDLRSPLMSISVTTDLLLVGSLGVLNEKGQSVITKVQKSIGSLMKMINDLLELEGLCTSGVDLYYESTEITTLMEEAVDMVAAEAERKEIQLSLDGPPGLIAHVDRERLRRVLINFLGNAIKFSPSNSQVHLSAVATDANGSRFLEVKVRDDGPGIPADKIEMVFEKFKQANLGREEEKTGSRLRLAICKAIVEAHRGTIGVDTKEGRGSTFWFKIPLDS